MQPERRPIGTIQFPLIGRQSGSKIGRDVRNMATFTTFLPVATIMVAGETFQEAQLGTLYRRTVKDD